MGENEHIKIVVLLLLLMGIGWMFAVYLFYKTWKMGQFMDQYRKAAQYKMAQLVREVHVVKKKGQEIFQEKRLLQKKQASLQARLEHLEAQRASFKKAQLATFNLLQDVQIAAAGDAKSIEPVPAEDARLV